MDSDPLGLDMNKPYHLDDKGDAFFVQNYFQRVQQGHQTGSSLIDQSITHGANHSVWNSNISFPQHPASLQPLHSTKRTILDINKDQLLQSRTAYRDQFTLSIINYIISKYNAGYDSYEIKFNEATNANSFQSGIGHAYLEHAIAHLQSKDFMCFIEEVPNNNMYPHKYVIKL